MAPQHAGPVKLVLHALGKNDSFSLQAAPIIKGGRGFHACPNLPLSKCLQHPARQERSSKEHSRPLSRSLAGSARRAAPPGHGWGRCLSFTQLGGLLVVQLPALPFVLLLPPAPSSFSFCSTGLPLQTGTKCPKHGKGPVLHCLGVKGANCFSWNMLQISHPFFPTNVGNKERPCVQKSIFTHADKAH